MHANSLPASYLNQWLEDWTGALSFVEIGWKMLDLPQNLAVMSTVPEYLIEMPGEIKSPISKTRPDSGLYLSHFHHESL